MRTRALLATAAAVVAPIVVGVMNASPLAAQTAAAGSPAFEAASVKLNTSRDGERNFDLAPGGRFTATRATLRDLVTLAYQLPNGRLRDDSQISGGPSWVNSDRFDIVAKAEGSAARIDAANIPAGAARPGELSAIDQVRLMLRTLLADRFKLTVHNEIRELPVYALVMARSDGRLGPQIRKVEIDCAAQRDDGGRRAPPGPGLAACGGFRGRGDRTTGHAVPMSMIAKFLEGSVGRVVIDRTGLIGSFDLDLQWTPDQPLPLDTPERVPIDPNGVSIFTAVQEQLGLKLESQKSPVDVLVIDRAEPPTPD